jgi:hypothetical protein
MATPAALGYVSYPPPLARKRTDGSPPNPDIQGRHASDFCIKRCYDFRGFEPDADLVIFASSWRLACQLALCR